MRIRPHALRHTYATHALQPPESMAGMKALADRLGHATISSTLDKYADSLHNRDCKLATDIAELWHSAPLRSIPVARRTSGIGDWPFFGKPTYEDAAATAVAAWWADRQAGRDTIPLAATNEQVDLLNQHARAVRSTAAELQGPERRVGERAYQVGDRSCASATTDLSGDGLRHALPPPRCHSHL